MSTGGEVVHKDGYSDRKKSLIFHSSVRQRTWHIPDRRTRVSACDWKVPLVCLHPCADPTCNQPEAFWCLDKTPGFHLSTVKF